MGKVAPASVETNSPEPRNPTYTVVGDAVSRFRDEIDPFSTGEPLLNCGALFPKLTPPSTDRNNPAFVATSRTFDEGSTMCVMLLPDNTEPPTIAHVSPASVDLYTPMPFVNTPPPSNRLPVPA